MRRCEYCGAYLDPEEKCDCEAEESAPGVPAGGTQRRENRHTFRLCDADEKRLQTGMARYGCEHLQDFVLLALRWFFEHHGLMQVPADKKTTASGRRVLEPGSAGRERPENASGTGFL